MTSRQPTAGGRRRVGRYASSGTSGGADPRSDRLRAESRAVDAPTGTPQAQSGCRRWPRSACRRWQTRTCARRAATDAEVYTHGHHESVLRSHTWRTAENSAGYLLGQLAPGTRAPRRRVRSGNHHPRSGRAGRTRAGGRCRPRCRDASKRPSSRARLDGDRQRELPDRRRLRARVRPTPPSTSSTLTRSSST